MQRFRSELVMYSLLKKKKDEPRNAGCKLELEQILHIDIRNPEDVARLLKEELNFMYSKPTCGRILRALLETLE
ncbi:hypothetical protein HOF46_03030 [Candidatus Woesearchaeota archaeon]|nr:hypothetical protein [Candidatus Woesearchaeota archaeon]